MKSSKKVLGVDIGGVILNFVPHKGTALSFDGDDYLNTPAMEGAFAALAALNAGVFKDSVYLVSKIKPGSTRVFEWLKHNRFTELTGVPMDRVFVCYERADKEAIVAKLGITHFVDDRAEVMSYMVGKVPNLFLFQNLEEDKEKFVDVRGHMKPVQSWSKLLKYLQ